MTPAQNWAVPIRDKGGGRCSGRGSDAVSWGGMGRIRILTDQVANQIAAGEVVDRPASVVKELVENALDAGAGRIRVEIEGGGRKLIRVTDNGHGMGRDDALLAFERHATSKLRSSDDLLRIATLGFRGEALPSIASVSRLELHTRAADEAAGTRIEIHGGRLARVEEAGGPPGASIAVGDLFFNTPARRKFLKSEQTETAHVAALVTHYALAHPQVHFELLGSAGTLVHAPPVADPGERVYQIFGADTLALLLPVAAERPFDHGGLPEPPPWRRDADWTPPAPGHLRVSGFSSKPELQKLNRNSIYLFVNGRLIRDRLLLHALGEAYRNVLPPTSHPVALLFLEMPPAEVDVNVHPSKTEVRFRQPTLVHDFLRDTVRYTLIKERPAASFPAAITTSPNAREALATGDMQLLAGDTPPAEYLHTEGGADGFTDSDAAAAPWTLAAPAGRPEPGRLPLAPGQPALPQDLPHDLSHDFPGTPLHDSAASGIPPAAGAGRAPGREPGPALAMALGTALESAPGSALPSPAPAGGLLEQGGGDGNLHALAALTPLGQLRASFILATGEDGLWIIDQHVAHERILFEKILRERAVEGVQRQRLLMPLLVDLLPEQMARFPAVARELERNGFEAEPFGPRTIAIKAAPMGLEGRELERMLTEVLDAAGDALEQGDDLQGFRARVAASLACHAAIKVNTPLDGERMGWLLRELARTEHPTSCPHGRPIALRYAWKDIERAFHRH